MIESRLSASFSAWATRGRTPRGTLLALAAMLGGLGLLLCAPVSAMAEEGPRIGLSKADHKEFWQSRFRELRQEAAVLKRDAAIEWELYADANRRNYRRGKVRHIHRDKALELEVKLAEVEEELNALPEAARRSGALPGWIREVESEPVVLPPPGPNALEEYRSMPSAPADAGEADDREGRNPIFVDEEG